MGKLLIFFMIILLCVGTANSTLFDKDNGVQKDVVDVKSTAQEIIQNANSTMQDTES
ncbi:hypothetical protein [Bacillus sp. SM2101]|uniref:hypothetical protein n=1 Tax=Bacillus sp. SM2101 TaxID=2805366 RepID=UPI001BDE8D8B|nr:hypothetical protein [Bacillus sp. SM2101]